MLKTNDVQLKQDWHLQKMKKEKEKCQVAKTPEVKANPNKELIFGRLPHEGKS